jgi:hypothetical protein
LKVAPSANYAEKLNLGNLYQRDSIPERLGFEAALHEQMAANTGPAGPRLSLELGIRQERETVSFWAEQAKPPKKPH